MLRESVDRPGARRLGADTQEGKTRKRLRTVTWRSLGTVTDWGESRGAAWGQSLTGDSHVAQPGDSH